ncbi:GNAT family N-acetyltransferase [Chitinophaga sp. Cy-1792]|uniref:GNAT family N-acetyltransferase n=1 Tax=Chitinophaga sp. Cy-1792 TaxID=2608339 RepID=UPI001423D4CB|nr:GNAT family N-acetyltransferase [Chitinophaga sp. Cy-1792]NIG52257.1 GNAT family N-acetyltransferase [Chitinophaga sp. Cy-1792]
MAILKYRTGTVADTEAICRLLLKSYEQFRFLFPGDNGPRLLENLADSDRLREIILSGTVFICFQEDDNTFAGVVFLVPSGNPTAIYPADWSYIRLLGVDPSFRGAGIGEQLMRMAISAAKASGERVLGLHTSTEMPTARRLYERLGFRLIRELDPIFGAQYWLYRMDL